MPEEPEQFSNKYELPGRVEEERCCAVRSSASINKRRDQHRAASTRSTDVASTDKTKIGSRDQVMPGARCEMIVASWCSSPSIVIILTRAKKTMYASCRGSLVGEGRNRSNRWESRLGRART